MPYTEFGIAGSLVCCSDTSEQDYEFSKGRIFPDIDTIFTFLQRWSIGIEEFDVAMCLRPYETA